MIINESNKSRINESITVDGYDPVTGELIKGQTFSDPAKAIEHWFKMSQKHHSCIAITPSNESEAMSILKYFSEHESEMRNLHSKYKCRYKFDYMMDSVNRQVKRGKSNMMGPMDQLDPFSLG